MYSPSSPRATPRQGIALPIALAAIVTIGALISGVLFASLQEYRVGRNSLGAQHAMNAAEVGLNSLVASWASREADTLKVGKHVQLPDTVIDKALVQREYTKMNHTTYWLTCTAIAGSLSLQHRSLKRLHTVIRLETPDFKIMGAITGRGMDSIAGSGKLSGVDTVPPGWDCPEAGPPAAGLVVGDSATNAKAAGTCMTGGKTPTYFTCVEGSPKVKDSTALVNDVNTYQQFGGFNYDSLAKIADKTFLAEPDGISFAAIKPSTTGTIPPGCNYGDPNNWGAIIPTPTTDPRGPCASYYPIIHLKGTGGGEWLVNGGPGSGGQGILLVDGNVKIAGAFQWTGLIITKGYFKVEGAAPNAPKIFGAVLAANSLVPANNIANSIKGDAEIRFSRCAINTIIAKRSRAVPAKYRAWADMSF